MEKVDTVVVDKTGTLTQGKPRLTAVFGPKDKQQEAELLQLAASLERASEHPLAEAVVRGAKERGVDPVEPENFRSLTGKGVIGTVKGHSVALGNLLMLREAGLSPGDLLKVSDELGQKGQTVNLRGRRWEGRGPAGSRRYHQGINHRSHPDAARRGSVRW